MIIYYVAKQNKLIKRDSTTKRFFKGLCVLIHFDNALRLYNNSFIHKHMYSLNAPMSKTNIIFIIIHTGFKV